MLGRICYNANNYRISRSDQTHMIVCLQFTLSLSLVQLKAIEGLLYDHFFFKILSQNRFITFIKTAIGNVTLKDRFNYHQDI